MAQSKSEERRVKIQTQDLQPERAYSYPTVGDGMTVYARSQEEADEKVAKLRASMKA